MALAILNDPCLTAASAVPTLYLALGLFMLLEVLLHPELDATIDVAHRRTVEAALGQLEKVGQQLAVAGPLHLICSGRWQHLQGQEGPGTLLLRKAAAQADALRMPYYALTATYFRRLRAKATYKCPNFKELAHRFEAMGAAHRLKQVTVDT